MDLVGKTLGQYQLVELIHQGENTVYKGFQPSMNRYVVVKVLNPSRSADLAFAQQFRRDMQLFASLEHPNILTVYDYGQEDGLLYMVTRYIEGGSLQDRLPPAYSPEQAQQMINPIADALDLLHSRGAIHGNLKPANILIDELGQPLLTDFGYTQGIDVGVQENVYLSPEQAQGAPVDLRTDVYTLGVLLYELVIGEPPPLGVVPTARAKRPDLPPEVEKVILKAMAQYPDQRFQTAAEFSLALNMALPSQAAMLTQPTLVVAPSPAPAAKPEPEPEQNKGLGWLLGGAAIVGLLILLACLFFAFLFGPQDGGGGNIIVIVPTPAPAVPSVTALKDTNIRTGPGTEYEVIGQLKKDQKAEAIGRSPDGLWWVTKVPAAPNGQGWVSAELVSAENTDNLPVLQPPPLPTPTTPGEVKPQPPKAVIDGTTQAQVGQTVSFTARNSQVAEGSHLTSFEWDFDDGSEATGVDVSHVYNDPGTYRVELTVIDDKGLSDTTTHRIKIEAGPEPPEPEEPPTAVINAPSEAAVSQPVTFDASGSLCITSCTSYAWEFGDGQTANAVTIEHVYNATGTYNVILTVTDDKGLQGTTNVQIQITEPEPEPFPEQPEPTDEANQSGGG